MAIAQSARIHPTALIDDAAEIGAGVEIGPFVIIEGRVQVGDGCVLKARSHLIGPLVLGRNNQVFSNVVLGEAPQHLQYSNGEDLQTSVEIGDNNIFRENVTVHRATLLNTVTSIGHHNFFMAGSHIAHDCVVGNHCILANGALVGGHAVLEDRVFLSGNAAVHQFCRVGRLALISGVSATSKDLPPFVMVQEVNMIHGVNLVGMRRAGIPTNHIDAVRRACQTIYYNDLLLSHSLPIVEKEWGTIPEVEELLSFIRTSKRGICLGGMHNAA